MTDIRSTGIHHITAVATDPQRNVDFYLRVLGLRLVKQTVNFDAPDTYHLYYGNGEGNPGSILTFFPWPGVPQGQRGAGQATTISFAIPEGSLGHWKERLERLGVDLDQAVSRFDEDALWFRDPDGLALGLVARADAGERPAWEEGPVPFEHAVRSFHSVELCEHRHEQTAELLVDQLGFRLVGEEGDRLRLETGEGGAGATVDVLVQPKAPQGLVAGGTVHHVAWRTPDDDTQLQWREQLVRQGVSVTPVMDRQYFNSIYFREPGGVLLEFATDPPGFTADEPLLELGRRLRLPPWLEPQREQIQAGLPPLKIPEVDTDETG